MASPWIFSNRREWNWSRFPRDLLLADNRMGDAGVAALCAGLGLLVDLHALNLDGNLIGPDGATELPIAPQLWAAAGSGGAAPVP